MARDRECLSTDAEVNYSIYSASSRCRWNLRFQMRRVFAAFLYSNTKRRVLIPPANWYGTGSASELAPCRQRLPRAPGRYRSLYRTNSPAGSVLAALHTLARSRQADKNQKIGVNPLYPRHPRPMNPYIHLITAITLKHGPMCDRSGRRSRSSALLRQQAWEHAYESQPAKPAADLQCGRRP